MVRSLVTAVLWMNLLMMLGCVIPPSLRVENDAGANSPPAIVSIIGTTGELAEPGPIFVERSAMAGNLQMSLIDTDVGDTLYVRMFVDYNAPERLPPRVQCTAPPNPNPTTKRNTTCDMSGLCAMADIGVQRNLSIVVFDRKPSDSGMDPQTMPADGLSTSRFYFLNCQLPQI